MYIYKYTYDCIYIYTDIHVHVVHIYIYGGRHPAHDMPGHAWWGPIFKLDAGCGEEVALSGHIEPDLLEQSLASEAYSLCQGFQKIRGPHDERLQQGLKSTIGVYSGVPYSW